VGVKAVEIFWVDIEPGNPKTSPQIVRHGPRHVLKRRIINSVMVTNRSFAPFRWE